MAVWGLAGLVTDTRQAKRFFPLIGGAAVLGTGRRGARHTTARGLARHREPDPRVAGDAGPRGGPRAEARPGRRRGRSSHASTAPRGRRRDARRTPTGPPVPAAPVDVGRIDPVLPPLLLPLPPVLASRGRAVPAPRRARRVPRAVRRRVDRGDPALGAPRDEPAPLPARCAHGDDGAARALPRGVRRADGRLHVRDPPRVPVRAGGVAPGGRQQRMGGGDQHRARGAARPDARVPVRRADPGGNGPRRHRDAGRRASRVAAGSLYGIGLVAAVVATYAMARVRRAYAAELVLALREGRPQVFGGEPGAGEPFGLIRADRAAAAVAVEAMADADVGRAPGRRGAAGRDRRARCDRGADPRRARRGSRGPCDRVAIARARGGVLGVRRDPRAAERPRAGGPAGRPRRVGRPPGGSFPGAGAPDGSGRSGPRSRRRPAPGGRAGTLGRRRRT